MNEEGGATSLQLKKTIWIKMYFLAFIENRDGNKKTSGELQFDDNLREFVYFKGGKPWL